MGISNQRTLALSKQFFADWANGPPDAYTFFCNYMDTEAITLYGQPR